MNATPPLAILYLHLTQGCNLACRHCWLNPPFDPEARRQPVLPFEAVRQAIDEARPLGLQGLKLTGGEPLLHPRLADIVALAARKELSLVVETNGTLVDDAIAEARRRHGRASVAVSLDSARPDVHDAFRGVEGAFAKSVAGVRRLAAAGLKPQVIASLIPENRHELEALVRLAETLGAESFKLNIVQPTTRGQRLHRRGASVPLPEILAACRELAADIAPRSRLRIYPDLPYAFRSLQALHRNGGGRCAVKNILAVLATEHYALCGIGTSRKELVFGAVGAHSLRTIWETHPVLAAIRSQLPERLTGVCGQCLMKRVCLGSCLAQNFYRGGSLFGPFWFCEQAARLGLFPASRLAPRPARATAPPPARSANATTMRNHP